MYILPKFSIASVFFLAALLVSSLGAAPQAGGAAPETYDIDSFFSTVDLDGDGSINGEEWKEMGLLDLAFPLCDANKDGKIDQREMAASAVQGSMDPKGEGILTVYAGGRFVIPSPGAPIPKPKNAPPGITQATQFVSDSPYVEGGPSGADFIKLFDKDGDGRVDHTEWESVKNDTVFQPFRWPQYNKNRDQWITLEEAPKPPVE
jgi:hypothetical protein